MRKLLAITVVLSLMAGAAQSETINARVNGMVCAFCAAGIEKMFRQQPAVDSVKVDLDSKFVTITTKPDQTMDNASITKIITDAGYTVTGITRANQ